MISLAYGKYVERYETKKGSYIPKLREYSIGDQIVIVMLTIVLSVISFAIGFFAIGPFWAIPFLMFSLAPLIMLNRVMLE